MILLRITQFRTAQDSFHVELAVECNGLPCQTATADFDFRLTPQDNEDLRWYFEDFLEYPSDPAPKISDRIESRMADIGIELFNAIFQQDETSRNLWVILRNDLHNTRIEISANIQEAVSVPWELLRDKDSHTPLALQAKSFVRIYSDPSRIPKIPPRAKENEPIRILLVICRPRAEDDVPFRSVAVHLISSLSGNVQLDILRPPTFAQLTKTLQTAKDEEKPYHIVHFDGHGVYHDFESGVTLSDKSLGSEPLLLSPIRKGFHGYLLFENPILEENMQLIDGTALGNALVRNQVPILVLNACRSAHAEPSNQPEHSNDIHTQVRAFGSLAQEVMDTGVAGVVAMRYNIFIDTTREFVANLYDSFVRGYTLGEAVRFGREQLCNQPVRMIGYYQKRVTLQDWAVPVVYESAPITLFPKSEQGLQIKISSLEKEGLEKSRLPRTPDVGFVGRHETLLALDRAFDRHPIVLLHAYAGSGKTTTAIEFARWYHFTNGLGLQGKVIFSSFTIHKAFMHILNDFGQVFEPDLQKRGINWSAIVDLDKRREVALNVLKQIPVLWIWDNIEPITGFPAGMESQWNVKEQQELLDFLRDVQNTKAKLLLTSRREEQAWLGLLPVRVKVPPMPMQERTQLAIAIADKHKKQIDVSDWKALLRFTQGNPMTTTVVVNQALREGLNTKEKIDTFVEKLRDGEAEFDDEQSEARDKSLGASLSYGFENAFTEQERKILAVLHLFQEIVNVDVLCWMGDPKIGKLSELHELTRSTGIILLNRVADIGLLCVLGDGYYEIHPALSWFFKRLYQNYYADKGSQLVIWAFIEVMGQVGDYCHNKYEEGNHNVLNILEYEEVNLLKSYQLALTHNLWSFVISIMQGLHQLYDYMGRHIEWEFLIEKTLPYFINMDNDLPLTGHEEHFEFINHYRVRIAKYKYQLREAERLQKIAVEWHRERIISFQNKDLKNLNWTDKVKIRAFAVSLHELAEIQLESEQPDCIKLYKDCFKIAEQIDDQVIITKCAFNMGNAYTAISEICNLDTAEYWYQFSLQHSKSDQRSDCYLALGYVWYQRSQQNIENNQPKEILLSCIKNAANYYEEARKLLSDTNSRDSLAWIYNILGTLYCNNNICLDNFDLGLSYYKKSIDYDENQDNLFGASDTRFNIALGLAKANRFTDALEYAFAALKGFQTVGESAKDMIQKTNELVDMIQKAKTDCGI